MQRFTVFPAEKCQDFRVFHNLPAKIGRQDSRKGIRLIVQIDNGLQTVQRAAFLFYLLSAFFYLKRYTGFQQFTLAQEYLIKRPFGNVQRFGYAVHGSGLYSVLVEAA